MSGHIYCFTTHENPGIIKAGHTQQDVRKRLRGYLGPAKPRAIIFQVQVDDSVHAERMMLELMRQCASLAQRHDLGNEWFERRAGFKFEECATQLQNIAKIVQKASKSTTAPDGHRHERGGRELVTTRPAEPAEPITTHPAEPAERVLEHREHASYSRLQGLEQYFKSFDKYVEQLAPAGHDPLSLLQGYESSSFCPYGDFCRFLRYPRETRVEVTANRYANFLYSDLPASS